MDEALIGLFQSIRYELKFLEEIFNKKIELIREDLKDIEEVIKEDD